MYLPDDKFPPRVSYCECCDKPISAIDAEAWLLCPLCRRRTPAAALEIYCLDPEALRSELRMRHRSVGENGRH